MPSETFEHFMARCLHAPKKGYYARNIRTIGSRGDFTTAPHLSEAPAKAIAQWATRAMQKYRTKNLIEMGPGSGILADQVLRKLPFHLRYRAKFHLVESSPVLQEQQIKLLGKRATYHHSVATALEACGGKAVIYSNELVDAFPVRIFENTPSGWQELAVVEAAGFISETTLPPAALPDSSIFKIKFPIGQRVEIHESYKHWLESWLPLWSFGEMLTIDYGAAAHALYHRRPHGSIRAHLLNQKIEGSGIYQNQGLQDLTADVNFTDLSLWALPWLDSSPIQSFDEFLQPHSSGENLAFLEAASHFTTLIQTVRQKKQSSIS